MGLRAVVRPGFGTAPCAAVAAPLAFVPGFTAAPELFLAPAFAGVFLAPFVGTAAALVGLLVVPLAVFFAAALVAIALPPFAGAAFVAVVLTFVLLEAALSAFFTLGFGVGALTAVKEVAGFSVLVVVFAGAGFVILVVAGLGAEAVFAVVVARGVLAPAGFGAALALVVGTATAVNFGLAAVVAAVLAAGFPSLVTLVALLVVGIVVERGVLGFSALVTGSVFFAGAALVSFVFVTPDVVFVVAVALVLAVMLVTPEIFGFSVLGATFAAALVVVDVAVLGVLGLTAFGSTCFGLVADAGFVSNFDTFGSDFAVDFVAVDFFAADAVALVSEDFFELVVGATRGEGALVLDFSFGFAAVTFAVVETFGIPEVFGFANFDAAGFAVVGAGVITT